MPKSWSEHSRIASITEGCALTENNFNALTTIKESNYDARTMGVKPSTERLAERERHEKTKAIRQTTILWQDIKSNTHKTPKRGQSDSLPKCALQQYKDWYYDLQTDFSTLSTFKKLAPVTRVNVRVNNSNFVATAQSDISPTHKSRFEACDHFVDLPEVRPQKIPRIIKLPKTREFDNASQAIQSRNMETSPSQRFKKLVPLLP